MFILWSDTEKLNLKHFPSPKVIWAIHTVNLSFCQIFNCSVVIKTTERVKKAQETLRFPWWPSLLMFIFSELQRSNGQSLQRNLKLEMRKEENLTLQTHSHGMILIGVCFICWGGDRIVPVRSPRSWLLLFCFWKSGSWSWKRVF